MVNFNHFNGFFQLYLIWFGPQVSDNNVALGQNIEGGILGEVAIRSGGEIIRVTEESVGPDGNLGLVNKAFFFKLIEWKILL